MRGLSGLGLASLAAVAIACSGELGEASDGGALDGDSPDAPVTDGSGTRDAAPPADAAPHGDAALLDGAPGDAGDDAGADPAAVSLTLTITGRWVGERTAVAVSATREDGVPARGTLELDFGDGASATVASFEGSATRRHAYASQGDYRVEARLDGSDIVAATVSERILVMPRRPVDDGTDHLDLSSVSWIDPDISGWEQTSQITSVGIEMDEICVDHTHAGTWPAVGDPAAYGNPWVFAWIDGSWYAGTFEWMRPDQICKALDPDAGGATVAERIGPHVKREPLESWVPRQGELVGFMYSGWARFGMFHSGSVRERSNVVLVEWPF